MKESLKGVLLMVTVFTISCNQTNTTTSYTEGSTKIVIDETFAPIVEDQLLVFQSQYPDARLDPIYKPEADVLKLFLSDSVRVAILSKQLGPEESKFYESRKINVRVRRFAVDAIALIAHKSVADTTVTVNDIIDVLKGRPGKIKSLVFDNPKSSTVRYLKELANVEELPANGVYALESNAEVIRYVDKNPGVIGVVGVNWIKQPGKDLEPIVDNLRTLGIRNLPGKPGSDNYYKPSQSNIALEVYPLIRNLYILNGQGGPGIGSGFAAFLYGARGQRIVLKSGLLPDSLPSREVIIRK